MEQDWLSGNRQSVMDALQRVRAALLRHGGEPVDDPVADGAEASRAGGERFALDVLCEMFGLSPFERDLLLLCAGVELDAAFAALCARAQGEPARAYPTFSLALAALPGAHWSAITPGAALRHWRLIDVRSGGGAADSLMTSPLRIDERILHYLAGVGGIDEQLLGFVSPVRADGELVPSQRHIALQIAAVWSRTEAQNRLPAVQLVGDERTSRQAIAAAACAELGLGLYQMDAQVVPTTPHELDILMRLWEREAALSGLALLLDGEMVDRADAPRQGAVTHLVDRVGGALIVAARERRQDQSRPLVTFDVQKPMASEQHAVWQAALGPVASALDGHLDRLVAQFNLGAPAIHAASLQAIGEVAEEGDPARELPGRLWQACRGQARPRLDDLAQRIEPVATWDDLVLPERERASLRSLAVHVKHRVQVYDTWGFGQKSARGLGISALFAGPSGTGKTMAAEVLANELQLDLYRVDLSQAVSKYIGETEKNLRRIFDAAEEGGAILLFDEADALFGKRSEVKDSHDRYANIEVSYLLQRMESYRGLAILTTNVRKALDQAFMRRLRFVVQFPFPDAAARAEIWGRIFPGATPTEGLDVHKLGRLNVAGGNIRNIALNAAFLAADSGEAVGMGHVLEAARAEYYKLEKTLTDVEIKEWV